MNHISTLIVLESFTDGATPSFCVVSFKHFCWALPNHWKYESPFTICLPWCSCFSLHQPSYLLLGWLRAKVLFRWHGLGICFSFTQDHCHEGHPEPWPEGYYGRFHRDHGYRPAGWSIFPTWWFNKGICPKWRKQSGSGNIVICPDVSTYPMLSHAHGITKICLSFERKQPYLKEVSLFLFHEYVRVWFLDYDSGQLMYIYILYMKYYEIYIYICI